MTDEDFEALGYMVLGLQQRVDEIEEVLDTMLRASSATLDAVSKIAEHIRKQGPAE